MNNLRIGYFADGPWSHKTLLKLLEEPCIKVLFICGRFDTQDAILRQLAHKIKNIV
jgi:methionyl-tRNA formyltransferase